MEWIDFKDNPPEDDTTALVCNKKGWMNDYDMVRARYNNPGDVWVLYDPNYRSTVTVEVSHYLPIPKFELDK